MSVVQNPDGQIAYLEKYNPYKSEATQTEPEGSVHVLIDDQNVYISEETYNIAEELQSYARFIKCICLIDAFITAINIGTQYPYGIVVCIISLCGYQGAARYDKIYLYIYSGYQCIKIITKLLYIFYIQTSFITIIFILSTMFDCYVLSRCKKFINLLP